MKKICTLLAVTTLYAASVSAQTVSDDFNDNSRDAAIWNDPELDAGNGQLDEIHGRVEFSATSSPDNFVMQQGKVYPVYNQAWQASAVVSLNQANFNSGGFGFVTLEVGSNSAGDNYVGIGNGAGFLPGASSNGQAVVTDGGDANTEDNLLTFSTAVPETIGVRIAYDPRTRMIHVYYDLDTDQNDGEWTLLRSYTIDGSTVAGAFTLDWGMTSSDNFGVLLSSGSENAGVTPGSAWFDDFEFIPGQTLLTPTFADDFDDNSRDVVNWSEPTVYDGNGQLLEQNERVEFGATASDENFISQSLNIFPTYEEEWQAQMVVSISAANFTQSGQTGFMGIEVNGTSPGDKYIDIAYAGGIIPELLPDTEAVFSSGADPSTPDDGEFLSLIPGDLPDAIGIRITYDPQTRIMRTYYDLDADQTDGEWTLLQTFTIDGSTVAGANTLDWGMTSFDSFIIGITGGSEGFASVTIGSAWADDFEFNRGSTAQALAPLAFADDFNDDSTDPIWGAPNVQSGTPEFVEKNHRTELISTSSSGEHELNQSVSQQFWPSYAQAFEVKVEAHCLPAGANVDGTFAITELQIANDGGDQDLFVSVGVLYDEGVAKQLRFTDDSEINTPNDFPESIDLGITLPEVVGLRLLWNPETKIMSCYFDTDGDSSVESWELYTTYTLDNSDQGTTHKTDWGMAPTDQFRISISAVAENTVVTSGEAWFNNFTLFNAPPRCSYPATSSGPLRFLRQACAAPRSMLRTTASRICFSTCMGWIPWLRTLT